MVDAHTITINFNIKNVQLVKVFLEGVSSVSILYHSEVKLSHAGFRIKDFVVSY